MNCLRCHGLMVSEQFVDPGATLSHDCFDGWRCLCCGDIADRVVVRNRERSLKRLAAHRAGNRQEQCHQPGKAA
jgi:hypothetical protein